MIMFRVTCITRCCVSAPFVSYFSCFQAFFWERNIFFLAQETLRKITSCPSAEAGDAPANAEITSRHLLNGLLPAR